MSGGHFNYNQYLVSDIAEDIERLIATNDDETKNAWGEKKGHGFSPEIIERFKEAAHTLRQAAEMAERVDWLVSGDDGEDSFMSRWDEEVRPYWGQDFHLEFCPKCCQMTNHIEGRCCKCKINYDAKKYED